MVNYPVGDFLIRIKNASMAGLKEVSAPGNNQIKAVAQALKKSGFLEDFSQKEGLIFARLAFSHKRPVLMNLTLVSRPGLRIYMKASDLEKKKGPSIFLLSTPKGVISSTEAKKMRLGGEVIAEVL